MIVPVTLFILGLALLIKGGDWFVDGAVGIAQKFRIPELIIGATVVSIGTTLPEVMVSASSAMAGHGELAYGNAIGSIICNSALIAAVPIVAKPGPADGRSLRMPMLFFTLAAVLYAGTAYDTGYFNRPTGALLLLLFVAYIAFAVLDAKRQSEHAPAEPGTGDQNQKGVLGDALKLFVSAALIAIGARLLVDNGILIAQALGVPESVVALTMVALGTSLPELVTAVTALLKGHDSLSLGNIVGANMFNLVLVSGLSIVLAPFEIPQGKLIAGRNASLTVDIPVMLLVMTILAAPVLLRKKTSRLQGLALLGIYIAFCAVQFIM